MDEDFIDINEINNEVINHIEKETILGDEDVFKQNLVKNLEKHIHFSFFHNYFPKNEFFLRVGWFFPNEIILGTLFENLLKVCSFSENSHNYFKKYKKGQINKTLPDYINRINKSLKKKELFSKKTINLIIGILKYAELQRNVEVHSHHRKNNYNSLTEPIYYLLIILFNKLYNLNLDENLILKLRNNYILKIENFPSYRNFDTFEIEKYLEIKFN